MCLQANICEYQVPYLHSVRGIISEASRDQAISMPRRHGPFTDPEEFVMIDRFFAQVLTLPRRALPPPPPEHSVSPCGEELGGIMALSESWPLICRVSVRGSVSD